MQAVLAKGRGRRMAADVDEFVVAVEMSLHTDDLVPAREAAAGADEMQRGLRAGGAEPDAVRARDHRAQAARQFLVGLGLKGIGVADLRGLPQRPVNGRMRVAQQSRAVGAAQFDELAPFDAPHPRTAGA